MACVITDECTACDACPQVCPNDAILSAAPSYVIIARLCTECVGFDDAPQCGEVCPAGAIVLQGFAKFSGEITSTEKILQTGSILPGRHEPQHACALSPALSPQSVRRKGAAPAVLSGENT